MDYKVQRSRYVNVSRPTGLLFILHNPWEWPNSARFIPTGVTRAVRIWATTFYVSPEVRELPEAERKCMFQRRKTVYLDGLPYLRPNCISDCRQAHSLKYCNCSVDFLFPSVPWEDRYPDCNISDLRCLNEYNGQWDTGGGDKQLIYLLSLRLL